MLQGQAVLLVKRILVHQNIIWVNLYANGIKKTVNYILCEVLIALLGCYIYVHKGRG